MSLTSSGMRGGQPSTTQPAAAPWLSPNVVTRNRWPNVLNDMGLARAGTWYPAGPGGSNGVAPAAGSAVAAHAALGEAVDDTLTDVDRGRLAGRGDAEDHDQGAGGAAMGDDHGVSLEAAVPLAHARGDLRVAFPTRRREAPLVALARGKRPRRARADLR